MGPKPTYEGYLLIDHKNSPGLPEDVARRNGYNPKLCGEGKAYETATMSCRHCRVSVVPNPLRLRPRNYCSRGRCNYRYICDACAFKASQPDFIHMDYTEFVAIACEAAASRGLVCI